MSTFEALRQKSIKKLHSDPASSYTLAAPYYTSPEVFEREKEAIFYRAWNFAGHSGQVAKVGDYVTLKIMDQDILIIRGKDDRIRGFYNVCSHRAHELLSGSGNTKVITCPYHAWSYHADGRLRSARGSEKVSGFNKDEFCLKEVQIETFLNFLFVNLDPEAPSLKSQSGNLEAEIRSYAPRIEELTFSHRLTYELKANWKNVVDNFLECYHCPPAHPAFVDLVDVKNYRSVTHDIYSSHISPPGRADNKAYRFNSESGASNFAAWWIWPNVTFNTFPGRPNMSVLHIMPTGPETTLEHFDFYFLQQQPDEEGWAAIKYVDEVLQPEDIGLVESVQRGLHSRGYLQGRYIVDAERTDMSEHAVHHFHSLVLGALNH